VWWKGQKIERSDGSRKKATPPHRSAKPVVAVQEGKGKEKRRAIDGEAKDLRTMPNQEDLGQGKTSDRPPAAFCEEGGNVENGEAARTKKRGPGCGRKGKIHPQGIPRNRGDMVQDQSKQFTIKKKTTREWTWEGGNVTVPTQVVVRRRNCWQEGRQGEGKKRGRVVLKGRGKGREKNTLTVKYRLLQARG